MPLPIEVETQIFALNEQLNILITNRDRIVRLFDEVLGVQLWGAIPTNERHFIRDLIVQEMSDAPPNLTSIIQNIAQFD